MGAEPYDYTVPYERDLQSALNKLRQRVFADGDYNGAELNPSTMEEALELAEADGTRSILDISQISASPNFFCAAPFTSEELRDYFGTDKPTAAMLRTHDDFWEEMERGQARYIVLYANDEPTEIFFAGYSFD